MRYALFFCLLLLAVRVLGDDTIALSSKQLNDAKRLYNAKCSRCHKFYNPSSYDDSEWHEWMEKMRKKSKLKSEQYDLLTRYTDMLRKDGNSVRSDPNSNTKLKPKTGSK